MAEWDDNNEGEGLSEVQQMQMDEILLDTAYNNAWMLLSGELTFDELMMTQFKTGRELIMAFDPDNGPKENEFQNMIDYYVENEEYEKCAKLRDLMLVAFPNIYKA